MGFIDIKISVSKNYKKAEDAGPLQILNQAKQFEVALKAMDHLFKDEADIGLDMIFQSSKALNDMSSDEKKNHIPAENMILELASGVIYFLEATLGFEPSKIAKAQEVMTKAENLALKAEKYNVENKVVSSEKYAIGLECKIAYIEACLLNALLMLFTESYMDSIKALYKLKKAHSGLSNLNKTIQSLKSSQYKLQKTQKTNKGNNELNLSRELSRDSFETCLESADECHAYEKTNKLDNSKEDTLRDDVANTCFENDINNFIPSDISTELFEKLVMKQRKSTLSSKDEHLIKLMAEVYEMRDSRLRGSHLGNNQPILRRNLGDHEIKSSLGSQQQEFVYLNTNGHTTPTIDEFIESGVSLCYGIIQLILSILPPAVTTVLNAIGFNINKLEGLQLLWDVVHERNIFSGLSLGGLVIYYHGPFKFIDNNFDIPILDEKVKSLIHPGFLLEDQILKATCVFPGSSLWILQEAMVLSSKGELKTALDVINKNSVEGIQMLQIKAQMVFCRALLYCFTFDFEKAAEDFLYLLEINEWSHSFYTYFAGCCYLEAYRLCEILDSNTMNPALKSVSSHVDILKKNYYKNKAHECLEKAPTYLHKKKFMSNNLPFDNFMLRKLKQFKSIQSVLKTASIDIVDAVATSPIMELIYLYDGFNRMNDTQLDLALNYFLKYENKASKLHLNSQENVKSFLTASLLKNMNKFNLAFEIIEEKLLPQIYDRKTGKFIKLKEDPWLYPSIFYELALINWNLNKMSDLDQTVKYLKHSLNYLGDYELSSRIGMRSQAALNRCQNK
ncbi:hypothetical protein QEN19_003093 [Hanseniaspora menglaensis]